MSASRAPCSAATSAVAAPSAPNAPVMAMALPLTVDVMSYLFPGLPWRARRTQGYSRDSCSARDSPVHQVGVTTGSHYWANRYWYNLPVDSRGNGNEYESDCVRVGHGRRPGRLRGRRFGGFHG